jgi:23S rRNA pseudouridine2605 synthase
VIVTQLGTKVESADTITFDGRPVRLPSRRYYIALNKPRGVVSSRSDSHAAHVVTELVDLPSQPMLRPVGRLDAETDGLIFLTDDGDFLFRLTHPRHHVPKTYRAVVRGIPSSETLTRIREGVLLEDCMTAPARDVLLRRVVPGAVPGSDRRETKGRPKPPHPLPARRQPPVDQQGAGEPSSDREAQSEIELTIFEGRNRQVRRMMAAVGHPIVRLTRIRIGSVQLTGLPSGAWRHLTPHEITALTRDVETHQTEQENTKQWPAPQPSRPQKARSSQNSSMPTPRSRPRTSLNSPKKASMTD